jgi:predicted amidohydrolase
MKIGLAQMNSQDSKSHNLNRAAELIDRLAQQGAEFVVLPEYFNYLGPDEHKPAQAEPIDASQSLARISAKAREYRIHIHLGSFLERGGDAVFNTSVVFDPRGEIIATYRKIHLFDVRIPGGREYLESETLTAGNEPVTFAIGGITFGLAICYDLRFPELFRRMSDRGAQVLLVPAAFTLQTGRDHWELLARARAVENLCWVVAVGQWGKHPPANTCFGRSMVIDPWGLVTVQAQDGETTALADIDMETLHRIRESFPALGHRRGDLFSY